MALEMSSDSAVCFKCGRKFGRRKGNFPVSYAAMHKGVGYMPYCKYCVDQIYEEYLAKCNDPKTALRQTCRKFDIYWNETVYYFVQKKSSTRSVISQYLAKINTITYAGKSYDDTLISEGTLWNFGASPSKPADMAANSANNPTTDSKNTEDNNTAILEVEHELDEYTKEMNSFPITKDVIAFWGPGYSPDMYPKLEQRRAYWMSRIPDDSEIDIGLEAIIRQICSLELDINRDRAAGKPVDKNVTVLNNLLGSANWKPIQKKEAANDNTLINPLGVWLYRYENDRPLPKTEENLKDINHNKKNIFTWMGHLCKMLSKKNGYTRLYDEEISKWRVERPEYDEEDDETMLSDIFEEESEEGSGGES